MEVKRLETVLHPDVSRVCFRPINGLGAERQLRIASRILHLDEAEVPIELDRVLQDFEKRHDDLTPYLNHVGDEILDTLCTDAPVSEERQTLLGACLTQEYALEAAALFNPSMVPHPDQSGVDKGSVRFVMSLRAVGEGHISSVAFRSGVITPDGDVKLDEPKKLATVPDPVPNKLYESPLFERKLSELGLCNWFAKDVLQDLGETFTLAELRLEVIRHLRRDKTLTNNVDAIAEGMIALAMSNYEVEFEPDSDLSERILFPYSPAESRGIEDARFVRFVEPDGQVRFIATYTAYDGYMILPQIVETSDFVKFAVKTLNGPEVQNKGMALFPRKVNGHYTMLSRQDGENLYLMISDDLHFWYEKKRLMCPQYLWESVQIGNCGSPIETPEGWLFLTHGVGPMRRYCIGAALLDLDDPLKVIGRLDKPLISPLENEREGYVPNVVYSCGGMVHNGKFVVPYGISDQKIGFGVVDLDELLIELKRNK